MISALMQAYGNLFKKPATRLYPIEASPVAKNYRGLIKYNEQHCIFCLKCEDVCPPGAILFDTEVDSGKQTYFYNPYLCIYCSECVRACPEPGHDGALWQEEELIEPSTDTQATQDDWFDLEARYMDNREAHKEKKKQDKLKKKQEEEAAAVQAAAKEQTEVTDSSDIPDVEETQPRS